MTEQTPAMIDVLMPVYNCEAFIADSIASIRRQTIQDVRMIVVDDGSTDGTRAVVEAITREDPRVILLTKPNSGVVDSLNLALSHCTAPYIARQDADDVSLPERFARQIAFLDQHPDCAAVSANAYQIDETGRRLGRIDIAQFPPHDMDNIPAREPYILGPFFLIRAEVMREMGGFRQMPNCEDSDLCWRLMHRGRIGNVTDVLGLYRIHSGSLTSASVGNGRFTAGGSQMAAISAQRRRDGRPDIDLSLLKPDRFTKTLSLSQIYDLVSPSLEAEERRWYLAALIAKFLEQCTYRPFQPQADDLDFIDAHLAEVADKTVYFRVRIAARMLLIWRNPAAFRLLRRTEYPKLVVRIGVDLGKAARAKLLHKKLA